LLCCLFEYYICIGCNIKIWQKKNDAIVKLMTKIVKNENCMDIACLINDLRNRGTGVKKKTTRER